MKDPRSSLDGRLDGSALELVGRALRDNPLRVLSEKGLELLEGERALEAALLRVDLWIKLDVAREAVQLSLLRLDRLFFVLRGGSLLRDGLDERVEFLDLAPSQGSEEKSI